MTVSASDCRVAVIGSNSFSGADFVDLLLDDPRHDVIGISRSPEKSAAFLPYKRRTAPRFAFHQLDLNHDIRSIIDVLDDFAPATIVNFAAQSEVAPSWEHPEHWFRTNVASLAELMNTLRTRSYLKRYVHISSPEVYGTCEGTVTERAPLNPSTPYAASKAAADLFLQTLVKNFSFPLMTVRATNVYGAHQQLFKIIPRTVISLKKGRKIPLHGGGVAVKSYIHIRDVSRGELAIARHGRPGEIYHLSPDQGWSVREIVSRICGMMHRDFDTAVDIVAERQGQDAAYVIDSTKARETFGWSPQVSLDDGLRGVIQWIEDCWTEIDRLPHEYIHQA